MKIVFAAICIFFLVAEMSAQKSQQEEQHSFGVEGQMDKPVSVPAETLPLLIKDNEDIQPCEDDNGQRMAPKPDWFSATRVHLTNHAVDLLVKAENACMWGAHIGPFWVLRKTHSGWKRIFKVRADGVDILKESTNGNKDIRALFLNAKSSWSSLFRFRNGEYRLVNH